MHLGSNTICAPVHQPGSAITIIRVSGPDSIDICDRIFIARRRGRLTREKGYTLVYGDIVNGEEVIDEVIISIYRAPHSYTGEDMVEIACHGSFYIQNTITGILASQGASPASAGEFTRRAFMNGKLDLSQAEAIADLIAADSGAAHRIAISQLKGGFSNEIAGLRSELLNLVSLLELELDFGEEDVQFADRNDLLSTVVRLRDYSGELAASFSIGNAVKRGIPTAIAGKPNVGKSTLLNGLLNEERAIVSEIPGTTRDAIEDTLVIEGVLYRFIDTAGLRHTEDIVERLGIGKTREKIALATIVILVTEAVQSAVEINREVRHFRRTMMPASASLIIVVNKADLAGEDHLETIKNEVITSDSTSLVVMSANRKDDYMVLKKALASASGLDRINETRVMITNARHYEALMKVSEATGRVVKGLETGLQSDLIAIDVRQAIHYLGEITGAITTDEILGNIFRNFCIGK